MIVSQRQPALEALLDGQIVLLPVRRLADDGLAAWAEVLARGFEGLVAKDPAAPYTAGRTLAWLKVKVPRYRDGERGWEPSQKS
jgi:ATP-dependent DNA ligase